jgi:hypothetical protein
MAGRLSKSLKHAFNAFTDQPPAGRPTQHGFVETGHTYGGPPDRMRLTISNERSIIASIYTRLAIDCAAVDMRHVRLDAENRYLEDIDSGLNNCLTIEANLDQAARAFRQDIFSSLFEHGTCAIVPVDTTINPATSGGFDILTLRVGQIVAWHARHVRVSLYNEATGRREEITLEKKHVAIIQNPLYNVMNEPNSTLQRLIRKLNLLDAVDEQSSSGKLDLIIQLPYTIRSETRRQQAMQRRKDMEFQLKDSKYGVAYADATEKITQLNRPAENNLLGQVEYLMTMLYGQLGLTPEVMNGTADEAAMLYYHNRTVEPLLSAATEAMQRTFLTKTARTQKQAIRFFRDPFKLVPAKDLAELADKFGRNEIFSSNEFRTFMGVRPSKDPKAEELRNSNMPAPLDVPTATAPAVDDGSSAANDALDQIDSTLDGIFKDLGLEEGGSVAQDAFDDIDDSALLHARVYDPAKARAYYLRTRQLKGRQSGRGEQSSGGRPSGQNTSVDSNRPETQAATKARVAALEARLDKLKAHLATLVADAKKRSGVEPTKKADSKEKAGSSKTGGKSDLTAAEKREKAKKAREEYEKKPEREKVSAKEEIEKLQADILEVETKIRAAIAEARAKSNSKTAPKGR